MQKILLIEDDVHIQNILKINLENDGYHVDIAGDGQIGYDMYLNNDYNLLISDINMPNMNGNQLVKKIKTKDPNQKIIMLTALSDEVEELNSFSLGADDYIKKPFSYEILKARIITQIGKELIYTLNDLTIDLNSYIVMQNNKQINITKKEFDLLVYFFKNPNVILTRDRIINSLWKENFITEERLVDAHVKNIRKKLNIKNIITIKGMGYRFEK